jgi:hypothetical protein
MTFASEEDELRAVLLEVLALLEPLESKSAAFWAEKTRSETEGVPYAPTLLRWFGGMGSLSELGFSEANGGRNYFFVSACTCDSRTATRASSLSMRFS